VTRDLLLGEKVFSDPRNLKLRDEEKTILDGINQLRASKNKPALRPVSLLCQEARKRPFGGSAVQNAIRAGYKGKVQSAFDGRWDAAQLMKLLEHPDWKGLVLGDWGEIGVGFSGKGDDLVLLVGDGQTPPANGIPVWEGMKKKLVSQTHALHFVDINGDGKKDLVTGRRWWAHAAKGDPGSWEPAFLFWFEAVRGSDGFTQFVPHLIDDDSGVGTQFAVEDINGDGLPDIVVANKRGVFVFEQVRRKED
jgi:hypothetical protein